MLCDHETYAQEVARIAESQVGVREVSHNRGPEIDAYVWSVGLRPTGRVPWCMAFVYWCHRQAAHSLNALTTCPRTAGVVKSWAIARKAGALHFRPAHVSQGMVRLCPGDQFLRVRVGQLEDVQAAQAGRIRPGHTGIVVAVDGATVDVVEGNTDAQTAEDGQGVHRKTLDTSMGELFGYVRHTACADP